MPSKSRAVKGPERDFLYSVLFIDCNHCSHREERLNVIFCLSSPSFTFRRSYFPAPSLSQKTTGSPSRWKHLSHQHVTHRETQTDCWGGDTEQNLTTWERGGQGRRQDSNVWGRKTSEGLEVNEDPEDWNRERDRRQTDGCWDKDELTWRLSSPQTSYFLFLSWISSC